MSRGTVVLPVDGGSGGFYHSLGNRGEILENGKADVGTRTKKNNAQTL